MSGLFVTATGTDIGKTFVAAGILKTLRSLSIDAVPMKPVQSGADFKCDEMISPDLNFSLKSSGINPNKDELQHMAPYIFGPACSPHLAAEKSGKTISLSAIEDSYNKLKNIYDFIVIEGAGGILVPLNKNQTMLDLMKQLNIPVLLVASTELGTINHTLLSIECLRSNNVELDGVIFNAPKFSGSEFDYIRKSNKITISSFGDIEVLAEIPYFINTDLSDNAAWKNFQDNSKPLYKYLKGLFVANK